MLRHAGLRTFMVVALCLLLAVPGFPQNYGNIGPGKGEVIGIIAGAAAVLGVTAYLIYRGTHQHASIRGCVTSDRNALSLRNDKDKETYFLGGDSAAFRPGQHVALSGKKRKDSSGRLIFEVQKLKKELGECQP